MAAESARSAVAFFDVDGTLVWHDFAKMRRDEKFTVDAMAQLRPTPAVYDAFARMHAAGHLTFICTGRHLPFIPQTLRELNPDGFIAGAGAYVCVGDATVRDEHIEKGLLLEIARHFEEAGLDVTLESDTKNVELLPRGGTPRFEGSDLARTAADVAEISRTRGFCKFCTKGLTLDDLAPMRAFLDEHFTICDLQGGVLEFSLLGVDKGTGIAAALAYLGHGRENTFAFGDSENDLPMAGAVETFVAMGNALPNVRERAGYVTDSAAQDGVVTGLEHFGLI